MTEFVGDLLEGCEIHVSCDFEKNVLLVQSHVEAMTEAKYPDTKGIIAAVETAGRLMSLVRQQIGKKFQGTEFDNAWKECVDRCLETANENLVFEGKERAEG